MHKSDAMSFGRYSRRTLVIGCCLLAAIVVMGRWLPAVMLFDPAGADDWPWHDKEASSDVLRQAASNIMKAGDDDDAVLFAWLSFARQFGVNSSVMPLIKPSGVYFLGGETKYSICRSDVGPAGWHVRNRAIDIEGGELRPLDEDGVFLPSDKASAVLITPHGIADGIAAKGLEPGSYLLVTPGSGRLIVIPIGTGEGVSVLPFGSIGSVR